MTPRATVLLPVWNAAATLEVCLRSIARQTEERFEVLIVDDGSTDATAQIAKDAASRDGRFRLVERAHEGLVATLNAGIELAQADVVVRMDGDDIMHRRRVEAQLHALEDQSLCAVGCHVRLFPRAGLNRGLRAYEAWLNTMTCAEDVMRDAFIECPIAHPTLAIRRSVLAAHRYRDRGWPEDYDLMLRLLTSGERVGVVAKRLLMWRDHPQRLSRRDDTYGIDRFTACRAHFLARSMVTDERYVLCGFGHTGKALRRALADEGKSVAAIVDLHPGRLGQTIHGAPVIPPEELPRHRGLIVLASVAGATRRSEIRRVLHEMAFVEGRDFVCCA